MTQGNDRILETLESVGIVLAVAVIAYNTEYTRNCGNNRSGNFATRRSMSALTMVKTGEEDTPLVANLPTIRQNGCK